MGLRILIILLFPVMAFCQDTGPAPYQLQAGGAASGNHLYYNGSAWGPTDTVVLASGTVVPTGVDSSNVASTIKGTQNYLRVGNTITVSGLIRVTPSGAGNCYIELTVPINSDFSSTDSAQGVFQDIDDHFGGGVRANATSNAIRIAFVSPDGSEHPIAYHYTYTKE